MEFSSTVDEQIRSSQSTADPVDPVADHPLPLGTRKDPRACSHFNFQDFCDALSDYGDYVWLCDIWWDIMNYYWWHMETYGDISRDCCVCFVRIGYWIRWHMPHGFSLELSTEASDNGEVPSVHAVYGKGSWHAEGGSYQSPCPRCPVMACNGTSSQKARMQYDAVLFHVGTETSETT